MALTAKCLVKPASGTWQDRSVSFKAMMMVGLEGDGEDPCSDASLMMNL